MIVYVETNFILEMAFLRDECAACQELIALAERKNIRLILPSFCVGEPYEAATRRWKQRREFREKLESEIRELARSQPYANAQENFQEMSQFFAASSLEEKERLDETLEAVLKVVEIIPINLPIVQNASQFTANQNLSPQDSLVLASVLSHAGQAAPVDSCFITQNSKDFVTAKVVKDLAAHGCKLLTRFNDGLGYVRSKIAPTSN